MKILLAFSFIYFLLCLLYSFFDFNPFVIFSSCLSVADFYLLLLDFLDTDADQEQIVFTDKTNQI
jgi:hypothetical protein